MSSDRKMKSNRTRTRLRAGGSLPVNSLKGGGLSPVGTPLGSLFKTLSSQPLKLKQDSQSSCSNLTQKGRTVPQVQELQRPPMKRPRAATVSKSQIENESMVGKLVDRQTETYEKSETSTRKEEKPVLDKNGSKNATDQIENVPTLLNISSNNPSNNIDVEKLKGESNMKDVSSSANNKLLVKSEKPSLASLSNSTPNVKPGTNTSKPLPDANDKVGSVETHQGQAVDNSSLSAEVALRSTEPSKLTRTPYATRSQKVVVATEGQAMSLRSLTSDQISNVPARVSQNSPRSQQKAEEQSDTMASKRSAANAELGSLGSTFGENNKRSKSAYLSVQQQEEPVTDRETAAVPELTDEEDAVVSTQEIVAIYVRQAKTFEKKGEFHRAMKWYKDAAARLLPKKNLKLENRIAKLSAKLNDQSRADESVATSTSTTTKIPSSSPKKPFKHDAAQIKPPEPCTTPVKKTESIVSKTIIHDPLQDILGTTNHDTMPEADDLEFDPKSSPLTQRRTITKKCARESLLATERYKESARKRLELPNSGHGLDAIVSALQPLPKEVRNQPTIGTLWKHCYNILVYLQQAHRLVNETLCDTIESKAALRETLNSEFDKDVTDVTHERSIPKKSVSFCTYDTTVVVHPKDGEESSSEFVEEMLCILDQAVTEEQKVSDFGANSGLDLNSEVPKFIDFCKTALERSCTPPESASKLIAFIEKVIQSNCSLPHDKSRISFLRSRMEDLLDSLLRHLLRRAFNVPPGPRDSTPVEFQDSELAEEWASVERSENTHPLWSVVHERPLDDETPGIAGKDADSKEIGGEARTSLQALEEHCQNNSSPQMSEQPKSASSTMDNAQPALLNLGKSPFHSQSHDVDMEEAADHENRVFDSLLESKAEDSCESDEDEEVVDRLVIQQNSGSCVYNCDDLASLIHRALRCIYYLRPVAQALTLVSNVTEVSLKDIGDFDPVSLSSVVGDDVDLGNLLQLFVNAHTFLSDAFVDNDTMLAMIDLDIECWGKIEHFLGIIRKQKVEDLKPLLPLGNVARFVSNLKSLLPLVASAQESAETIARTCAVEQKENKNNETAVDATVLSSGTQKPTKSSQKKSKSVFQFPNLVSYASVIAGTAVMSQLLICPKCNDTVGEVNPGGEIACSVCLQWLHLRCLGLPEEFPDTVTHFLCEKCNLEVQNGGGCESDSSDCDSECPAGVDEEATT